MIDPASPHHIWFFQILSFPRLHPCNSKTSPSPGLTCPGLLSSVSLRATLTSGPGPCCLFCLETLSLPSCIQRTIPACLQQATTKPGAGDTAVTKGSTILILRGHWLEGKMDMTFTHSCTLSCADTHAFSSPWGDFPTPGRQLQCQACSLSSCCPQVTAPGFTEDGRRALGPDHLGSCLIPASLGASWV